MARKIRGGGSKKSVRIPTYSPRCNCEVFKHETVCQADLKFWTETIHSRESSFASVR